MTLAQKCISFGWKTEAEGKKLTFSTAFNLKVTSGIDWFDLQATADFNGQSVGLPTLLAALKARSEYVTLEMEFWEFYLRNGLRNMSHWRI